MPSSLAPLAHRCAATGLDRLSAQAPGLSSRDERLHPNTCARGAQDGPDPGHGSSSSGNPQRMGSAARRLRRWDSVAGKAVRRGCLRGRADGGDRDVQADDGREDEPSRRKTISTMLRSSAGASPCPRGHRRRTGSGASWLTAVPTSRRRLLAGEPIKRSGALVSASAHASSVKGITA